MHNPKQSESSIILTHNPTRQKLNFPVELHMGLTSITSGASRECHDHGGVFFAAITEQYPARFFVPAIGISVVRILVKECSDHFVSQYHPLQAFQVNFG